MRAALVFALLVVPSAAAQPAARLAEIGAGAVVPSQPFGAPWSASPGVGARLALPLHGGTAEAALRWVPFASDVPETPGFDWVAATVGWGPRLELGAAALTPVARVGAVQFRFDPDVVVPQFAGNESEAEVAVGAALRAEVGWGRAALWAEGEALRIALSTPETVASLSAGVAVRFGLSRAVRRLLDE